MSENYNNGDRDKDTCKHIGNSVGNLVNLGYAVDNNEEVFFVNISDQNKIYKLNIYENTFNKVNDDNSLYINVFDDYIYYSNVSDAKALYRIKCDGSNRMKLNNEGSAYINVVDDWVYYSSSNDGNRIYKVKIDGTSRIKLNEDSSIHINVVDNWIYYCNHSDGYKLYKITIDGKEKVKLNDDASRFINVCNDYIYYKNGNDGNKIYRIKTDGTSRTKINEDNSMYLNVVDEWIYYSNGSDNNTIYKIKTSGNERTKLNSIDSSYLNVCSDFIIYKNNSSNLFYKVDIDGNIDELLLQGNMNNDKDKMIKERNEENENKDIEQSDFEEISEEYDDIETSNENEIKDETPNYDSVTSQDKNVDKPENKFKKNKVKYIVAAVVFGLIIISVLAKSIFFTNKWQEFLEVKQTTPVNNASDIKIDTNITVEFNEQIIKGNAFNDINLADSDGNSIDTVIDISNNTINIKAKEDLDYDKTYHLTIPKDAVSNEHNLGLKVDFLSYFTTEADPSENQTENQTNAPSAETLSVVQSYPGNGEIEVSVSSEIQVSFNQNISSGDNFNEIALYDSMGNIVQTDVYIQNNNLIIHPKDSLAEGTDYLIKVPTGSVKGNDQSALYSEFDSNFKTVNPVNNNQQVSTSENGDYIFPNSSEVKLTAEDIAGMDAYTLRLARNEMFARHGYVFNDPQLRAYFESKSWYAPDPTYNASGVANDVEKYNANLIKARENKLKAKK